jgi:hypothetical protein
MTKRKRPRSKVLWGIAAAALVAGAAAFSAGMTDTTSQLAVGIAADMQCTGDYDSRCQYPGTHPQSRKRCLIGKPCQDITSGHVTSGTCQADAKCRGEQTGGMMPMLPMLPMPMPKMGGTPPAMEQPCTATASTTASSTSWVRTGLAQPCPAGTGSNIGETIFGSIATQGSSSTARTNSWGDLLSSLLGFSETDDTGTSTDAENAEGGSSSGESGFAASIRRGVQTIVMLTGARQAPPADPRAAERANEVAESGFFTTGSTFVSSDGTVRPQEGGTLQAVLDTLGSALRALLEKLKP